MSALKWNNVLHEFREIRGHPERRRSRREGL
jgi:hypothetical protein